MKKTLALIMMVLIIQLPIISAQTIFFDHSAKGSSGIEGIVAEQDQLDIEAIFISDEELDANRVWLDVISPFDECTQRVDGKWRCRLAYPSTGTETFEEVNSYRLNLLREPRSERPDGRLVTDTVSGEFVVDSLAPQVSFTNLRLKANDELNLQFSAVDQANAQTAHCSGLKEIQLKLGDQNLGEPLSYTAGTCQAQEEVSISLQSFSEGDYTLELIAKDQGDRQQTYSFPFVIDRSPTVFSNVRAVDANDNTIEHIASSPITATLAVGISEDTNTETVFANLEALNPAREYDRLQGQCSANECIWSVEIAPAEGLAREIILSAQDDVGNAVEETIALTLNSDTQGPRISEFRSNLQSRGVLYLTDEATLEVLFFEAGIGLDAQNAFLDLSNLGLSNKQRASSCERTRCVWEVSTSLDEGSYEISAHPDTQDLLGNKVVQTLSANLIVDRTPPLVVGSPEIFVVSTSEFGGYATHGDSLEIKVRVLEPGVLFNATADLSTIIGGAHRQNADDCREVGDDIWECSWVTAPINTTGFSETSLGFSFSDIFANVHTHYEPFTVYEIESSFVDLWEHTVECSPSKVDLEASSLIEQNIYCHVNLRGNAEVISLDLRDCDSESGSHVYVRKQELINAEAGSTDPYIKLTLHAADIQNSTLDLTCPLIIRSATRNSVTATPEPEEVKINIPTFNSPLGEYGAQAQERADEAVEAASGTLFEIMTSLRKIFFYAERICGLISTINNVGNLINKFSTLKRIWGGMSLNPALEQSGSSGQSVTMYLNSQMKEMWLGRSEGGGNFVNKFCKFVSCRLYYDEIGWGGDTFNAIGGWQRDVLEQANNVATGWGLGGFGGVDAYTYEVGDVNEQGDVTGKTILQGGKLNPKDSAVLSVLTLCIPGIIYHVDKYRQIQCLYADCLKTSADTGVPIDSCREVKKNAICKYVAGEVFQLAPFTGLIDQISNLVRGALSSPFGVIDITMGLVCQSTVVTAPQGPLGVSTASIAKACLINEMAGMIADIWSDIANIKDNWTIRDDYCAGLEE